MLRKPRPRSASILTRSMPTTLRVVGIFMAVCLLVLAQHGDPHFGSAVVASTMAVTAFAACRSVGGPESRSPTGGIVTVSTFSSRQMNWISLLEVVLLILVVGLDLLSTWPVTTGMTWTQSSLSLAPA
jgi:P-type Ca2+ transporter type 2C